MSTERQLRNLPFNRYEIFLKNYYVHNCALSIRFLVFLLNFSQRIIVHLNLTFNLKNIYPCFNRKSILLKVNKKSITY